MIVATHTQFDICGDLPTGITVLEASAGTGKTYAIAALATRYVAEGIPLEKLLLVTFTILATGELRDRVRERLVSAEHGLERVLEGGDVRGDAIVELLARGEREAVEVRRERLALAIADFDSATIATTHSFCQEMLGGLGIIGDVEPDRIFVEDINDLIEEVVDDFYVRKFVRTGSTWTRAEALKIAKLAVANSEGVPIEPVDAPANTRRGTRVNFAKKVIGEVNERKKRLTVTTYDDWLTNLKKTLTGDNGPEAARRLRDRYKVVLVDEFQDTDLVQWEILDRAFGSETTLVLIGDPKQAIYAFRGADVYSYLTAARTAGALSTLPVNYRSDQGLIDAYDALFGGAQLGHEGIVYGRVCATEQHQQSRLRNAPGGAPLRMRVVHNDAPGLKFTAYGNLTAPSARDYVAADLAADVAALLESGAEVEGMRVKPGHIAVLVRKHAHASTVRDALEAMHVPAVINGAGSVFNTAAAREWLRLLEAIERPTSPARARSAALTPFLGWTAESVALADDDEWENIHRRLHHWARVLRRRGVASLTETITLLEGLPARVLEQVDGERRMTDLRHIGQLLHAAAVTEGMGAAALTAWLRRRIDEAESEIGNEERTRRLESDADAVQVLTIHRSKGLEFPIVYCPYLWDSVYKPPDAQPLFFHDPANDDVRTLDVGLEGPDWDRHRELQEAEERGEDLRLAYVALTRAKHQAVVWWTSATTARHSALARLLFAREPDGYIQPKGRFTPSPEKFQEKLESLGSAQISIERASFAEREPWQGVAEATAVMSVRRFDRTLDWGWRRTSYTDITAGAHDARVASEPEDTGVADEPDGVAAAVVDRPPPDAAPVPLGVMPAGAQIGTFVHRVFEAADFAAADLDAELAAQIAAAQARGSIDIGDSGLAAAGLKAALETPLGPLVGDLRLCDLGRGDRLDELTFELPLAGGDDPTGRVTLESIADTLRAHGALASYADRLADPALRTRFSGYLTGSIDLVARIDGPRFAVVDYKTNWLAPAGAELTAWHHRPAALAVEMERSHYHLQALLYLTALHRYLRWRMPGYDPEVNLAGVLYLFVRGMTGGDDGSGIYSWRPPAGLVAALSDALEGT